MMSTNVPSEMYMTALLSLVSREGREQASCREFDDLAIRACARAAARVWQKLQGPL